MDIIKFDLNQEGKPFKILNATNGGPWHKRHANDQWRTNFEDYKAAKIPFSRNHDSNLCSIYGGPYSHDITAIFPDFSADVNDPKSYDFACTDESIAITLEAGTEIFFRLGQTIEHQIKKHGVNPPANFKKWAEICEHIILHYNYGWADGFEYNIRYWEIWNEPDLGIQTWTGTKEQFFDLYEITAKHLKKRFPDLKIGGPALAGRREWDEEFLAEMQKREVPMDFHSWHIYCQEPTQLVENAGFFRNIADKHGYSEAESILNEWNYNKDWAEKYVYSIETIHSIKGAAFAMACISVAQQAPVDMLMYYDTRPSVFCGAFDFYTYRPLKGYYPLKWYGEFYSFEKEIKSLNQAEKIYTLCGKDKQNKTQTVLTYYTDCDNAEPKEVKIEFNREGRYEVYLLDKDNDGTLVKTTDDLTFTVEANTCLLIKEI